MPSSTRVRSSFAVRGFAISLLLTLAATARGGSLVHELTVEAGELVGGCLRRSTASRWDCVKNESLAAVQQLSDAPRIVLLEGIQLVRSSDEPGNRHETHSPSAVGEQDGTIAATWSGAVLSALRRLLDTHVLEVDLAYPNGASVSRAYGEGRHRRRQQMIPMMIFGVTVFGMFIIPIAFQFLTALSGKAFLMAKLALLLASMNGLKREPGREVMRSNDDVDDDDVDGPFTQVASAGVHYGLYHAVDQHPVPAPHPPPPFHQHSHALPLLYERAEGLYADGPRRSSGGTDWRHF
ncbi:AGAP000957-PA [Anopheles gambiae str. PEST]|uniref:AGAP000957-PA n=1 Tax=Anopheles gambiae TaxID=7165 RepID=Q5TWA5_ANOGA|nr:AGAP000957-PA [Anopheles gambiae str. PEST]